MHAASIQDADSAGELLRRIKPLYNWLRAVFADSIYDRLAVLLACFLLGLTLIVVRRVAGTKGVTAQNWLEPVSVLPKIGNPHGPHRLERIHFPSRGSRVAVTTAGIPALRRMATPPHLRPART